MRTEDLIKNMVAEMKPVRPVSAPWKRLSQWLIFSSVATGCYILATDPRSFVKGASPAIAIHIGLLLVISIAAGLLALNLSIPGRPIRFRIVPAIALAVWSGTLIDLPVSQESLSYLEFRCTINMIVVACAPAIIMFFMLRKAAPVRTRITSFFALLASFALGAIAAEVSCPSMTMLHAGFFHFVPLVGLSLGGLVIGTKILRW